MAIPSPEVRDAFQEELQVLLDKYNASLIPRLQPAIELVINEAVPTSPVPEATTEPSVASDEAPITE